MTLAQITRIWVSGRSPATTRLYVPFIESLEARTQELLGKSIVHVTTSELIEILRIHGEGKSAVTKNTQTWMLKGFFATAKRLAVRQDNPADEIRPPKFENKLADRLLTHEQVETLIDTCDGRTQLLIRLLYGAGLRISEATALRKKDLLGGGTIRVWGKGEKTDYVRIQTDLEALLVVYSRNLEPNDFLFPGNQPGKRLSRQGAWECIKRVAKKAGLPQVSPHFFRHAHATSALANGAPINVVSKSLRHSNITTTMKYSHVLPGEGSSLYLPPISSKSQKPPVDSKSRDQNPRS